MMKLWEEIDKYIGDLKDHKKLAKKIAKYVSKHDTYYLGYVANIIDEFYGANSIESRFSGSIAQDIKCLWDGSL